MLFRGSSSVLGSSYLTDFRKVRVSFNDKTKSLVPIEQLYPPLFTLSSLCTAAVPHGRELPSVM